ncbi:hypothetical protein DN752_02830 [Echinicola strongylocentroti]|uniref:Uncharacterized protein n=1 Tax=Echinicola strongylocentroti TaxID=1795355 RepID=A0A2Z4IDN4_9BACT|nr:hypothetical protein [Echinicola strongylocentroti]AWW29161.1 hypothetical protein DN752_02830 [Echinicola strongylocentroti]
MKDSYTIERECSNCGSKEQISVSRREAAFELVDINEVVGKNCKKCSATKFIIYYQTPDLDFELLKEWATNPELYLMGQDEELLLADEKYLDNILNILDNVALLDHKRNLLMDALCVIVYDNTIDDNKQKDENLKERVIKELNKRIYQLKQADDWIMDYIKEVVYPQLELKEK